MQTGYGELESATTTRQVLDTYDPASDTWESPFDGPFWKAVRHAHSLGRRGRGNRVALIDSGCNVGIPRLRRCVNKIHNFVPGLADDDPVGHGTTVALLITEVAPEASVDVYRVTDSEGRVDLAAAHDAILAAAESDATVINLSLGDRKPIWSRSGGTKLPDESSDPDELKRLFIGEEPPCSLCEVANKATKAGKLVFAAVGNSAVEIYCPARALGVTAVGFQRSERMEYAPGKQIAFGFPVRDEAPHADLFVREIDGVLGSSFASPLFAGVGALGLDREELMQYISSFRASVLPTRWHGQIATNPGTPPPPQMIGETDRTYWDALCRLPHVHSFVHGARKPGVGLTDPANCIFCGFFAEALYVKLGLWLRDSGRFQDAIAVLNAACAFAPWSAEAHAYLGLAFYAGHRLPQALREMETANRLRPDHSFYAEALAQFRNDASQPR